MSFVIKRIYEPVAADDGKRVLVDRLWPRGVSKVRAHLDEWFKEVSPSPDLRIWFGHRADRFEEFAHRYLHELETDPEKQAQLTSLREMSKQERVTLLYAAKSPIVNHARVLQAFLEGKTDVDWAQGLDLSVKP